MTKATHELRPEGWASKTRQSVSITSTPALLGYRRKLIDCDEQMRSGLALGAMATICGRGSFRSLKPSFGRIRPTRSGCTSSFALRGNTGLSDNMHGTKSQC